METKMKKLLLATAATALFAGAATAEDVKIGVLMGFTLYHDVRHIARAVYEGIAFALNSCAEIIGWY